MINRLKSICSNDNLFNSDLQLLKQSFLWSGYPSYIIEKFFKIALKSPQKQLQKFYSQVPKKLLYFGV